MTPANFLKKSLNSLFIDPGVQYAQKLILFFFWFFGFSFSFVLVVSGRFSGPEGVKKALGGLLGRVLTNVDPNLTTGDRNTSKKLTELASIKLTSIKA